ncbi:hypothetical protein H072_8533 [Dactylellina haptotyla CBS 200.50]|uniref:F-box domain-containing protein n=1 Tax=Dactylellina haptotyla (strain CBS 200.50) TaxID=1284197 RepID=S8BEK6_DACHA|nr:hypothetical protein H072_8533 [Dactylellina haptotyla CBS 200.50]
MPILSLPYELNILLASCLDDEDDLLALRLTCRELNIQFQQLHIKQIYEVRYVFFTRASLSNLIKISESKLAPRVRHLSFWPSFFYNHSERDDCLHRSFSREETFKQEEDAVPLLTKAFSKLPNVQSILFQSDSYCPENGKMRAALNLGILPLKGYNLQPGNRIRPGIFCYVKLYPYHNLCIFRPVLEATIRARWSSLKSICCPFVYMDRFHADPAQLLELKPVLSNLRHLRVGNLDQPYSTGRNKIREAFYTWIGSFGAKIEVLELWNPDSLSGSPGALPFADIGNNIFVSPKYDLAKDFHLPILQLSCLRKLSIKNFYLTVSEIEALLQGADNIEALEISNCRVEDPVEDWFSFMNYLQNRNLKKLQNLVLDFTGCDSSTEFGLPAIEVLGDWNVDSIHWAVRLPVGASDKIQYHIFCKTIETLKTCYNAESFWEELTDGEWKLGPATRRKRLRDLGKRWGKDYRVLRKRYRKRENEMLKAEDFITTLTAYKQELQDIKNEDSNLDLASMIYLNLLDVLNL